MDLVSYMLNSTLNEFYSVLVLTKNASEFGIFINDPSESNRIEAAQLFSRICKATPNITQLRYVANSGMEIIRVNSKDGETQIVEKKDLQDKRNREYLPKILSIPEGGIFVSQIGLNVENDKVVIPYEPTLRIASPVYKDSVLKGLILINFNPDFIISFFSRYSLASNSPIIYGLLDDYGRWILRSDILDFSILMTEEESITDDLPEYREFITQGGDGAVAGKENQYFIFPAPIKGEQIYPENRDGWFLAGVLSQEDVATIDGNFFLKYSDWILLIYFLLYGFWIIGNIQRHSHRNDLQIMRITDHIAEFTDDGVLITDHANRIIFSNHAIRRITYYNKNELQGKHASFLSSVAKLSFSTPMQSDSTAFDDLIWDRNKFGNYFLIRLSITHIANGKKSSLENYIGIYREPQLPEITMEEIIRDNNVDFYNHTDAVPIHQIADLVTAAPRICLLLKMGSLGAQVRAVLNLRLEKDFFSGTIIFHYDKNTLLLAFPYERKAEIEQAVLDLKEYLVDELLEDSCSLYAGMSSIVEDSRQISEGIKQARFALQIAMDMHSTLHQFSQEQYDRSARSFTIKSRFLDALSNNELFLVFQPFVTSMDNKIVGSEALIRWNSPDLGMISPSEFIPILEQEPSLMFQLGLFVIRKSIEQVAKLIAEENLTDQDTFSTSFNLAADDIMNLNLIRFIKEQLEKNKVPGSRINIEVTERTIMTNPDAMNEIFSILHADGINIAIDDFGIGFSSLDYLKKLRVSKIKIDRAFIKDFPNDDGAIAKAISSMAHALGIELLTEGVETEEQRKFLIEIDCEEYQGFLFSRPLEEDKFLELFRSNHSNLKSI